VHGDQKWRAALARKKAVELFRKTNDNLKLSKGRGDMSVRIWKALWWICLVVAPIVLIGIELFHPAGFTYAPAPGMFEYLSKPEPYNPTYWALAYPGPDWWVTLHMIQTPLVGLVAIGLWLLAARIDEADGTPAFVLAWLSRVATFVFIIAYTALDSIGGFGVGRTMIVSKELAAKGTITADQLKGVAQVVDAVWVDRVVGGVGSFISHTGSYAVFAATLLVALALLVTRKAPWPALLLLVAFGWQLQVSHASPHGPIAFSLLLVAALWMQWAEWRTA
jgi:hypothetical protein